ncbi:MAG: hypothetical protein K2L97_03635 [Muribaculaceae bacterium]|nr:hypothetical protein [Muribaculaceae bacterium]
MKGKINMAVVIPAILAVYLIVMMVLGWDSYRAGATSPLLYFGGSAVVMVCIILLHFHLVKQRRIRRNKK